MATPGNNASAIDDHDDDATVGTIGTIGTTFGRPSFEALWSGDDDAAPEYGRRSSSSPAAARTTVTGRGTGTGKKPKPPTTTASGAAPAPTPDPDLCEVTDAPEAGGAGVGYYGGGGGGAVVLEGERDDSETDLSDLFNSLDGSRSTGGEADTATLLIDEGLGRSDDHESTVAKAVTETAPQDRTFDTESVLSTDDDGLDDAHLNLHLANSRRRWRLALLTPRRVTSPGGRDYTCPTGVLAMLVVLIVIAASVAAFVGKYALSPFIRGRAGLSTSADDQSLQSAGMGLVATPSPTTRPSDVPSSPPSSHPTDRPSVSPSWTPTSTPTPAPTDIPSLEPSGHPSFRPTGGPTLGPTKKPTALPTSSPTVDPLVFYAMGDVPQDADELEILEYQLRNLPTEDARFVVHLGDMQDPDQTKCAESHYSDVRGKFVRYSKYPVFVVPGEAGYAACDNVTAARSHWETNFLDMEAMWVHDLEVFRSTVRPENFAFFVDNVLFVGINVPGGSEYKYLPSVWDDRLMDDLSWTLGHINERRRKDRVDGAEMEAIVVFGHAMISRSRNAAFFGPFAEAVQALGVPTLYMHGHGRDWTVDDNGVNGVDNLYEVQVERGGKEPPVRVSFTRDAEMPFHFDRRLGR